jgi:Chaperone of endosialidase
VQQPYLQQAFGQASTNLNNANNNTYSGDQVAQFTPDQLSIFQKMIGYGGNSSGADTSSAVGMNTANAGYGALSDALKGLSTYKPGGGTQSNIDAATAYANNPATDGMIDAAMRDARRSVSEQVLPQNARNDALSGNTMSSKSALTQGVVERGLADKTADTSATIRGQQFNTGLQLAEQGRQSDNSNILQSLLGGASAGNSAVGTGVGAIGSGIQQQGGLFDIANGGGAGMQQNTQNGIDNEKGKAEYASGTANQNLQNFFNIIGSQNWGGSSSGTSTSTPSMWNTIGSALGIGSSLYKLSDRRMKQDVKRIGTADNGLPIYAYRYITDPHGPLEIGFMAQDVEVFRPEAVHEIGGIKHVNYELASK